MDSELSKQKEKVQKSKPGKVSHKARSKRSSKFPADNNLNTGVAKDSNQKGAFKKLSMC